METTAPTTATERAYKVLGTTEDWDGCDCCGRMNLKVYVALEVIDESAPDCGEIRYMGTTCAARAEGLPANVIKAEAKDADAAKRAALEAERRRQSDLEQDRWFAWLDAHATPGRDRIEQMEELGGFAAARAAYRADLAA